MTRRHQRPKNGQGHGHYDRRREKDTSFSSKAKLVDKPVLYIQSRRFTSRALNSTAIKIYAKYGLGSRSNLTGWLSSARSRVARRPTRYYKVDNNRNWRRKLGHRSVTGKRQWTKPIRITAALTTSPPLALGAYPALRAPPIPSIKLSARRHAAVHGYDQDNGLTYLRLAPTRSELWVETGPHRQHARFENNADSPDKATTTFITCMRKEPVRGKAPCPRQLRCAISSAATLPSREPPTGIDLEGSLDSPWNNQCKHDSG